MIVGSDPQQNAVDIVSDVEVDWEVNVDKEVVVATELAVAIASAVADSSSVDIMRVSVSVDVVKDAITKSFVVVSVVTQLVFAVTVFTTLEIEGKLELGIVKLGIGGRGGNVIRVELMKLLLDAEFMGALDGRGGKEITEELVSPLSYVEFKDTADGRGETNPVLVILPAGVTVDLEDVVPVVLLEDP